MAVRFFFVSSVRFHLDLRRLRLVIHDVALLEGFRLGDVNIIFCDNQYIFRLNAEYLKHYYLTDVITFDYSNFPVLAGDIFIGVEVVRDNALRFSDSFRNELLRVILHGILHLCGYKDKTGRQKKEMRRKEDYYLKLFSNVTG